MTNNPIRDSKQGGSHYAVLRREYRPLFCRRKRRVEGEKNLRSLIGQLEGEGPDVFFVTEIIKVVLQCGFGGCEIYTIVDKKNGSNTGNDDTVYPCDGNNTGNDDTVHPCDGVLCVVRCHPYCTYVLYCKHTSEELMAELKEKINLREAILFPYVLPDVKSSLRQICNQGNVILNENPCFTYTLHTFQKLPEVPDGNIGKNACGEFEIRQLSEEHAPVINENWTFKREKSELGIREELQYGYGYGVFVGGRLVSWMIMRKYGSLGILHTLPGYRGRGYASMVVSALSRALLAVNLKPFVNVERNNNAGSQFFEKLGFVKEQDVDFCSPQCVI